MLNSRVLPGDSFEYGFWLRRGKSTRWAGDRLFDFCRNDDHFFLRFLLLPRIVERHSEVLTLLVPTTATHEAIG